MKWMIYSSRDSCSIYGVRMGNGASCENSFLFLSVTELSRKVTDRHPRRSPSKDPTVARSNAAWA